MMYEHFVNIYFYSYSDFYINYFKSENFQTILYYIFEYYF